MPDSRRTGPFRVIFGDEDHCIDLAVSRVGSGGVEVISFDGEGLDANDVVSVCDSHVMGEDRAVVIDNAHKVKNGDALLKFIENRDPHDRSVFLLVVSRTDSLKGDWIKAAAEKGRVSKYLKPKPWETRKQVSSILAEAKRLGVRLDDDVPEVLLRFLGYDLRLISNEISKSAYLVGPRDSVTKKDVLSLIPQVFPVRPREVAEAAALGQSKKAMTLLGLCYRNLGDGASVPITYAMIRLSEKLFVARSLSDKGASNEEVAQRLGMHAYAYQMNLLPLVNRLTPPRLASEMKNLCKLDTLVKGSASSKRTHVELAVLSLAS